MKTEIKRGIEIKLSDEDIKRLNKGEILKEKISDLEVLYIKKSDINILRINETIGYVITIYLNDFGLFEGKNYMINVRGENDENRSHINKELWDKNKR